MCINACMHTYIHTHTHTHTHTQPFAWEAREFLRKQLVGKEVMFAVDYKVPSSGREYGSGKTYLFSFL